MQGANSEELTRTRSVCFKEYESELKEGTEPLKKDTKAKAYCFTLNNWTEEELAGIESGFKNMSYWCIGKEIGESGTPHLQGYVQCANSIKWSTLKNLMPRAYITVSKAKGKKQHLAWEYCMKENNFSEGGIKPAQGTRTDLSEFREAVDSGCRKRLDLMRDHEAVYSKFPGYVNEYMARTRVEMMPTPEIELRDWEKELLEEFKGEPIDRRIIWLWSNASRTGKSTFMKYAASVHKDNFLVTDDLDKRNILLAYDEQSIIHIDLTRDITDKQREFLKSTVESLSDQKLQFSGKYQSVMKYVKAHIVVTANQPPIAGLPYRYVEYRLQGCEGMYERTNWMNLVQGSLNRYYERTERRATATGEICWFNTRVPEIECPYNIKLILNNNYH